MNLNKVVGLITARGGSKMLPRKNLLLADGKPLIAWTILAAQESKVIDELVLSSDDSEIIEVAKAWGCSAPFRRPDELASDTASSIDVILHALGELSGFEYLVLLQPTSPLRTAYDIDAAFMLMESTGAPSCVSVCEVDKSPYWMFHIDEHRRLQALLSHFPSATRRQDLPASYMLNGAIYIAKIDWFKRNKTFLSPQTVAYVMEKNNSIDIDTYEDFELFRSISESRSL